jgi:RNA polymerase sigma-70 factor (ECF subfamily)
VSLRPVLVSVPRVPHRPFPVAAQPRTMPHWGVASGRALRLFAARADTASTEAPARHLVAGPDRSGARPALEATAPLVFDELFRQYAPYVGALVLKLVGRPDDVDDVVQDVFLEAHRSLTRLRDPSAVRSWLRCITVRRARRWLRKRWVRRRSRESDVDTLTNLADPSASPEERAEIARVYSVLDRMSRDERVVWVLRFAEGETLESIAGLLGASVSTVQRRLRAAETLMRVIR